VDGAFGDDGGACAGVVGMSTLSGILGEVCWGCVGEVGSSTSMRSSTGPDIAAAVAAGAGVGGASGILRPSLARFRSTAW
jgi:hypothetical protein